MVIPANLIRYKIVAMQLKDGLWQVRYLVRRGASSNSHLGEGGYRHSGFLMRHQPVSSDLDWEEMLSFDAFRNSDLILMERKCLRCSQMNGSPLNWWQRRQSTARGTRWSRCSLNHDHDNNHDNDHDNAWLSRPMSRCWPWRRRTGRRTQDCTGSDSLVREEGHHHQDICYCHHPPFIFGTLSFREYSTRTMFLSTLSSKEPSLSALKQLASSTCSTYQASQGCSSQMRWFSGHLRMVVGNWLLV